MDCFPSCHGSELSSVWGFPHVATALFETSMDGVFLVLSSQIHQALDGFPYVTFAVPLSSGCGVPHVTALSQKAADGVPSCHCSELSSVWGFPHVVTALFQTSVDAVFLVLSRHI